MKPALKLLVPLVVLGLAALAACGGGGGSSPATLNPCQPPQGQAIMAYPAPGSTGIPDDVFGVIFASTNGLPSTFQALVLPPGQSVYFQLAPLSAAPSPVPSPNATPGFLNPVYQESAFGPRPSPFPANSTLQVYLNDSASVCTPTLMGTFNSQ